MSKSGGSSGVYQFSSDETVLSAKGSVSKERDGQSIIESISRQVMSFGMNTKRQERQGSSTTLISNHWSGRIQRDSDFL